LDELNNSEKFVTNQSRVINREELTHILSLAINQFDSIDLMTKINAYKIPAGMIQNMKEVFEMNEAKELLLRSGELTGVKTFVPKTAGNWQPRMDLLPPPHFGEHTEEILSQL
jgi:crotonobetainyl-CoA:carnitine CoA-transferase CaiB-like acyl-CoA transferase